MRAQRVNHSLRAKRVLTYLSERSEDVTDRQYTNTDDQNGTIPLTRIDGITASAASMRRIDTIDKNDASEASTNVPLRAERVPAYLSERSKDTHLYERNEYDTDRQYMNRHGSKEWNDPADADRQEWCERSEYEKDWHDWQESIWLDRMERYRWRGSTESLRAQRVWEELTRLTRMIGGLGC